MPVTGKRYTEPKICVHCKQRRVNRPRGLCWSCYYTPGVKDQHPSTSMYARRGIGNKAGACPMPEPTQAPPGSLEKIAVLEGRAKAHQSLFSPLDNPGYVKPEDHDKARSDGANGSDTDLGAYDEARAEKKRRGGRGSYVPRVRGAQAYSPLVPRQKNKRTG